MTYNKHYHQMLSQLFAQNTNVKLGLSRMEELLHRVGFTKASMRVIQVVGTNGKGSTVAFIESILRKNGISCGLFTSPHLCTARERIRLNGKLISEEEFIEVARLILDCSKLMKDSPSFFECMLAMALWLFQKRGAKVAILEAGLGGRLDATTACSAEVLGISMIDLDHQKILGDSIEAIAREKIAAARPWQKFVTTHQQTSVMAIIEEAQKEIGFELKIAPLSLKPLGLYGEHQKYNAGLALACVKALALDLDEDKITAGLKEVCWPGRFETVLKKPLVLLDGAHNPSGIKTLTSALISNEQFHNKAIRLVFGSLQSPNTREKIALLLKELKISSVHVHCPNNSRAESIETLLHLFKEEGHDEANIHPFASWHALIEEAATSEEAVVVCGSLYTVGEARGAILNVAQDAAMPTF